ncbi:DUF6513 domain-containing protein [Crateriforma conspicua]|uniref:DUF6513 domain-containing protein n=1 Tax=Crateriforma conspicua TaxID=2527996 RepID=UPI0011892702|nr:DUF6513 domain-containing protein [Crateriforma conspicua]QDV64807.1 Pterin binding enzyme [Crateriforma conspicua]
MQQDAFQPSTGQRIHLVTGKLAEPMLCHIAGELEQRHDVRCTVGVAPITVAALMTPRWLKRKLDIPPQTTDVVLPGFICLDPEQRASVISELQNDVDRGDQVRWWIGPKDCRELHEWFGGESMPVELTDHGIEIIAEINHAPRLSMQDFRSAVGHLRDQGADRIDIGCDPSSACQNIADYVRVVLDEGMPASIDTFDIPETERAVAAGADLVLSVNASNRFAAMDWGCEVVAIPDVPNDINSLKHTVDDLRQHGVCVRADAILEPIGSGFFASLQRYAEFRKQDPTIKMMMGIGNLTELTDVDSAGVNLILLAICEELRIESVLTTQVINWARSSVRECDHARRLVRYAVGMQTPPKRISDALVMLRDPKLRPMPDGALDELATTIRDTNYRIFADDSLIHLVSSGLHLSDRDAFAMFDALLKSPRGDSMDPGHAFYLGYEMAKATIAMQLGKQYEQDRALYWGMLTVEEDAHRIERTARRRKDSNRKGSGGQESD